MFSLRKWICLGFVFAAAATAVSQDSFSGAEASLSALIDTSNAIISESRYDVFYSHSGSDPDTYINSLALVAGSNWDPDIDLALPTTEIQINNDGNQHYVLGTAISGDVDMLFNDVPRRNGAITNVDEGIYDFSVEFRGGADSAADDLLGSVNFLLEVVSGFDLTITGEMNPDPAFVGQQSTLTMTIVNNMSNLDFRTNTWYVSGYGDGNGNFLQFDGFFGNWFGQTIAANGGSRTDEHSKWTGLVAGTYTGFNGVVGGLYETDSHFLRMHPEATLLVVVPEPATIAVLAAGALALLRRRRK